MVNTTASSSSKGISQKQIDNIAKVTGSYLKNEEKIKIRIATVPGVTDDGYVECCINGYNYIIKRGESVDVPVSIAELLQNAGIV